MLRDLNQHYLERNYPYFPINHQICRIHRSRWHFLAALELPWAGRHIHCKNFFVKFTKCLGNYGTKTLGKLCKPVCIFRRIGHTFKTNRITFSAKYFGPGVTKINCLNYKRNMKIMQNTVCLFLHK